MTRHLGDVADVNAQPLAPSMVVLDLDGTVVDSSLRVHPRTRAAIAECVRREVPVVLATGRMYRSAVPWAQHLGVRLPLICYGGALVRALPGDGAAAVGAGAVLFEDPLDPGLAGIALELARAEDWHFQAYRDDQLLCEQDRPEAHLYARIAQVPITFVDDLAPLVSLGTTKAICVIDDEAEAARAEGLLRARLGGETRVVRSLPPFVEMLDARAGKGRALIRLCRLLGLDPTRALAAGDAPNDIDLLSVAGYAVAVRGSRQDVLDVADATCAPPEDAGVADLLDALVLR